MSRRPFTSETVVEGHPDRFADRIGGTVLDAHHEQAAYIGVEVEGPYKPDHDRC
ncbi:adenosylhomocysteinase [Streptomyces sp. TLI_185]|uniref:adenosylhomocysteinase n=1 Tax=Streptomyces sp. TLI_185 TaxID=2485151 RepID=UPI000F4E0445|nr:adenosylhomocysteinase [Streptomyces sp. TLI_185]